MLVYNGGAVTDAERSERWETMERTKGAGVGMEDEWLAWNPPPPHPPHRQAHTCTQYIHLTDPTCLDQSHTWMLIPSDLH